MAAPGLPNPLPPDEYRGDILNGVAIGLLVPALLMVISRTVVRALITKNMGWDDWLMLVATPFLVADEVMSVVSTQYGIGRHIFYLGTDEVEEALKLNTIAQPLNVAGLFFVKASIVALLLRLRLTLRYRVILYTTLGFLGAISLAGIIIAFAQCQPFEKNWVITMTTGVCWSRDAFQDAAYILQGITVVTDLCYITIPIFYLRNVQMARSKKIGILAVIGFGAISMACSIAAIPYVQELEGSIDVSWNIIPLAAIKIGEVNVAMIVGCVPPLQPLIKRVQDTVFSRRTQTDNTYEAQLARLKLKPSEYEAITNDRSKGSKGGMSKASGAGSSYTGFRSYDSKRGGVSVNTSFAGDESDAQPLREHGLAPAGRGGEMV